MILQRELVDLRSQILEVADEIGAGELLCSYQLAANDTAFVDDVGLGKTVAAVESVGGLLLVENGGEVDVVLKDVVLVLGEVFIAGYSYDLDVGELVVEGFEAGHLFDAGGAPACPKVKNHDFAA